MENQVEIWKAHPDIPGIEVSTFGNVRTLDKVTSNENRTWFTKGHVLKQSDNGKGYLLVNFSIDEKQTTRTVHQLVARTFISNPDNFSQVNHLDCNRRNNNVSNLEWCTGSYNCQYREKFGKALGHPVFAVNLTTLEVSRYQSQSEASRVLGVSVSRISIVVNNRGRQANGYWFVNDDGHAVDVVKSKLHDIGKTGLNIKLRV